MVQKEFIPSQKHTDKFKSRIDILADPLYVVERRRAGERHGTEEWQYHHWKATDAARNCKKREYESIAQVSLYLFSGFYNTVRVSFALQSLTTGGRLT